MKKLHEHLQRANFHYGFLIGLLTGLIVALIALIALFYSPLTIV